MKLLVSFLKDNNYNSSELNLTNITTDNIEHFNEEYWIITINYKNNNDSLKIKCFFNKLFKINQEVN